jgi:hypothetical protein
MSGSRRATSLVVAAAVFVSSAGLGEGVRLAAAQPTEAELAAARNLFEEALALEDEGRWADALERVKKVAAVKTTAAVRFHLALCNEKLGHLVAAFNEFGRAEADAAAEGSPDAKRIESNSQKHAAELKARIPTVVLHMPPGVASVEAKIDGASIEAALFGAPIPLDPGAHSIVVHAEGRAPFEQSLKLAEGEGRVVDVQLPERASETVVTSAPSTASSPLPWIALSVGGAALVGAGVMYGLRASAISDLDSACAPARSQCPDDKSDVRDHGKTYNLVGNVLLGVGVAAVGTSVALFLLAPSDKTSSSSSGSTGAPKLVSAELIVTGGTLGLRATF